LYVVAVHCGLREGELLGLHWEDIDLETKTLAVRRTLSETKSGHILEAPKNAKGRNVRLTNGAVEALKRHRAAQNEERLRLGALWQDQGLVFPSRKGTTMSAKNLTTRSFKPILGRAGLPNIRLHDLRHTCATLLLSKGVHPKLVQELLGHATISITLDTYSHVLPGMGDQTAAAMESAFLVGCSTVAVNRPGLAPGRPACVEFYLQIVVFCGAPGRIRTCDRRIRSP
jgi:integrase